MTDTFISDSIKYIGADDTTLDLFESQYKVPNGMAYNSYIILDEKVAVMDTIDKRKSEEWFNNLNATLNGRDVDYIVISHLEPDHAANIKALADKYPKLCFLSFSTLIILMNAARLLQKTMSFHLVSINLYL